jgi:phosphotransferase system HPr (HPr) family protein
MVRIGDKSEKTISVTLTQDFHHDQLIQLVKETNRFKSYILIQYKNLQINAKNALSISILTVPNGEKLTICAEGPEAEQALEYITTYLALQKE